MVKICRRSLEKTAPIHGLMSDEELLTLVKMVQKYANDRPLTHPSPDPKDPQPLTPADLLGLGSRYKELMPLTTHPEIVYQARHMRKTYKKLWDVFIEEYLTTQQRYRKRYHCRHQYQVGDKVYLITEQMRQITHMRTFAGAVYATYGRYHIGIIRQIRRNQADGEARVLLVETRTGEIKRLSYMNVAPILL